MEIHEVVLSKPVRKVLKKLPKYIVLKLMGWIDDVGHRGLREVRRTPGYHDEPLVGKRFGQRSLLTMLAQCNLLK